MCVESELSMGNGSLGREWQLCPNVYFSLQCSSIIKQVSFNTVVFSVLIVTYAYGIPVKGQSKYSNVHCATPFSVSQLFCRVASPSNSRIQNYKTGAGKLSVQYYSEDFLGGLHV